jgi:hypothetical protein
MVMQSSDSCGLRLCGIAELPTVAGGTGSLASASSVLISRYTSWAIRAVHSWGAVDGRWRPHHDYDDYR